mgnify:CR=1 FL=1
MGTIQEAIQYGQALLSGKVDNAQHEAYMLLAHTIDKRKEFLIAHSDEQLSDSSFKHYQKYLLRRADGEPAAYILQQKEFWSLPLKVSPSVLIPRPETELMVEIALELLTDTDQANILDLGTGCGCIALALASEKPHAHITACDNSSACIDIARTNAQSLSISNVTFITSNWFEAVETNNFDIIISNPPYISSHDADVEYDVQKYEPSCALFSSNNGLDDIFHIIEHAQNYLSPGGTLLIEHGYKQADAIRTHFSQHNYSSIRTSLDMQHHERATRGSAPA